jgi:hypothetical protein
VGEATMGPEEGTGGDGGGTGKVRARGA